jgi:hypothetical protein
MMSKTYSFGAGGTPSSGSFSGPWSTAQTLYSNVGSPSLVNGGFVLKGVNLNGSQSGGTPFYNRSQGRVGIQAGAGVRINFTRFINNGGSVVREGASPTTFTGGGFQGSISYVTAPTTPGAPSVSVSGLIATVTVPGSSDNGGSSINRRRIQSSVNGGAFGNSQEESGDTFTVTMVAGSTYSFRGANRNSDGLFSADSSGSTTITAASFEEPDEPDEPAPSPPPAPEEEAPPPVPFPVPEELTGARLNRLLNQLGDGPLQPQRDINAGLSLLDAGSLEGNVLRYMLDVIEASEQGLLFMTKAGLIAFRERLLQPTTTALQFTDSGLGIPYVGVEVDFGTDSMVNQAVVEFPDGARSAVNRTSQVRFGVTEKTVTTELASGAQAQTLADFIVARFGNPEFRVSKVTVDLRSLSDEHIQDVLGLELGDQADLVFTPNGFGRQIALRNRVIGITHDVDVNRHTMSFAFEDLPFDFFVLNDEVFGILDNTDGVLGF